jgi:TolB-like protein/Tfp pilus assembly protein PilF
MASISWDFRPYLRGLIIDALGISKPPKNPTVPKGASIVVLPFDNVGGDSNQDYLVDGVTQELTIALSRSSRYVFVISFESAFTYKGTEPDPAQLGTELGVRYVLRGAIERKGERIEIKADLIEAQTGASMWSDSFESEFTDTYAVQAEIVKRILKAVGYQLETSELERFVKPPASIRSVESLWRAYWNMRQLRKENMLEARQLLQTAIEEDPTLANAYGLLAGTYTQEFAQGWTLDRSNVARAREIARKGLTIDQNAGACHAILGIADLMDGNWRDAVKYLDRAIALDPCLTWPHAMRGMALAEGHQRLESSRSIKRALRLDPNPPPGLLMALAYINYGAGRKIEAMNLLEKVRQEKPDNLLCRVGLVAYHQREGNQAYARQLAEEMLEINADMYVEAAMELIPALERIHPKWEFARYADDLAAAGLPRKAEKVGEPR